MSRGGSVVLVVLEVVIDIAITTSSLLKGPSHPISHR